MRSIRSLKLLSIALTAALAACGDSTGLPTAPAAENGPRFTVTIDNMASDLSSADFTVTSTGGVFQMGPHALYFPDQSICDPATSTYGMSEWDQPCQVALNPVKIHAELRTVDGYEWVEFSPALRFVPDKWVMIYMHASALRSAPPSSLDILWSPESGMPGIDESLTDPTLRTYSLPSYGVLYRRVKHFSGYQVSAGVADVLTDTISVSPVTF